MTDEERMALKAHSFDMIREILFPCRDMDHEFDHDTLDRVAGEVRYRIATLEEIK